MEPNRTPTDYPAESVFPQIRSARTSTRFFMLSIYEILSSMIDIFSTGGTDGDCKMQGRRDRVSMAFFTGAQIIPNNFQR